MTPFTQVASRMGYLYKRYVLRDPFLLNVNKWFKDCGDETLRLDYPLDKTSIVFDVGGYRGDFADAIYKKHGCQIFLFEPVPLFYDECRKRFSKNPSITCFNYGLSSSSGELDIVLDNDGSSFRIDGNRGACLHARVRSLSEVVADLGIQRIDLMKINIEGGEFDLLPAAIESGLIERIKFIQVQFHNFIPGAPENRLRIRRALEKSHREMWNYEFVWESWELL